MKSRHMTGRELARRVDLTNVSISRILHGKQKPSRPTVAKLAGVFSVSPDAFYHPGPAVAPGGFDGKALAALRTDLGIGREDLADAVGFAQQRLADLETGREVATQQEMDALASALDVEPDRLRWRPAEDFSGPRLRLLRSQAGLTPAALSSAAGVPAERLLLWEVGEQTPSVGEAARVEQILGADRAPQANPGASEPATAPTRGEALERIRSRLETMTTPQCLQVLAYVQGLSAAQRSAHLPRQQGQPPASSTRQTGHHAHPGFVEVSEPDVPPGQDWTPFFVPVIDNIAAGAGSDTLQAEQFPPGWAESFVAYRDAPPGAFAVRVSGDSMAPIYQDGDMIIVDPARQASTGESAVVVYQDPAGGARLARLKRLVVRDDQVVLESLNTDYPPVHLPGRDLIRAYSVYRHLPRRRLPEASTGQDPLGSVRRLVRRHRWAPSRDDSQSA
jgi:phage repressor protein C with HTH and peptisase S24 domain/DNA-binding XRE family transcriptional regulator